MMFLGRLVPAFIYIYSETIDFLLVHFKKYN
jgi:hypothetical protein